MIRNVLKQVKENKISLTRAEQLIRFNAIDELSNIAKLDSGRLARRGFPEVILAEGKSPRVFEKILDRSLSNQKLVFVSRADSFKLRAIERKLPTSWKAHFGQISGCAVIRSISYRPSKIRARIGIVTAGSSDLRVAEEAMMFLRATGCDVKLTSDVGIAGLQRTLDVSKWVVRERIRLLIVIAGMDGALPSILAGLLDIPIIAVPSSSGYGLGGKGVGALLTMLQSCAGGVAVLNIDNGAGAAMFASLVARQIDLGS
jgi:NCAIR mutase (PurE)-related protein